MTPIALETDFSKLPFSSFMVTPIAACPGLPREAPSVCIITLFMTFTRP
ncbi:MAG: hypothetical protein WCZ22_04440 [Dehalococcoidales bacterium]